MVKFVDLNDFRAGVERLTVATLLNLAEGVETSGAQKSSSPKHIAAKLVIGANYIEPVGKWGKEDVDALLSPSGRNSGGPIRWTQPYHRRRRSGLVENDPPRSWTGACGVWTAARPMIAS